MSSHLFYAIAVGFASGVFLRSFLNTGSYWPPLIMLVGSIAAAYGRRSSLQAYVLVGFAIVACSAGILRYDISDSPDTSLDVFLGESVALKGVVVREPDERESRTLLTVYTDEVNGAPLRSRVLASVSRYPSHSYGDRIEISGTLEKPESFEGEFGRTFDYPGYLAVSGIYYTVPYANATFIAEGEGGPALAYLYIVKNKFMRSLESLIPEPQAGLAEGLILGAKRALGKDLEHAFRATGIIHIVVLSGYNVTIVVEAVMRLLSFLFALRTRLAIGAIVIVVFALLVGLSATVVRASMMAVLVLVARATGRTYAVTRALVATGIIMLLINPKLLVFDPGFQLSFLATLGLILIAPHIESRLGFVPSRLQVREFVTATLATQLMVLPLLLYSIGELSLVSVPVNVLVLIAVPAAMLLTFLAGAFGLVLPVLGLLPAYAAYVLLSYILFVVDLFAGLPYASVVIPPFPFPLMVAAYVVLAIMLGITMIPRTKNPAPARVPAQDPLPFR